MDALDRHQLTTLRALIEEESVTRTAARLGVTQPAVSAQLRRLRASLGDPILVRSGLGLRATPRAQGMLSIVVSVLDGMRAILEPDPVQFNPGEWSATVSIAAVDYVQTILLPALIERLGAVAPNIAVSVRPLFAPDLAGQLERDEVQLALMPPGNAPEGARTRRLFDEEFVCALRYGHPALDRQFDLDSYCELQHVLVAPTRYDFSGVADRELRKKGRTRRVRVSVPNFQLAAEIVARSNDVATLPVRYVKQHSPRLQSVAPPFSVPGFTVALIWHERTQRDPRLSWLRNLIATLGEELPL